eukprot:superscaffoldBa00000163_g2320
MISSLTRESVRNLRLALGEDHTVLPGYQGGRTVAAMVAICVLRERHTHNTEEGERKARENKRFERDCQNVTGGNVSSEVERSQTEREQEVETIISVSESLRVALCDVTGSPSSVSTAEDKRGGLARPDLWPF